MLNALVPLPEHPFVSERTSRREIGADLHRRASLGHGKRQAGGDRARSELVSAPRRAVGVMWESPTRPAMGAPASPSPTGSTLTFAAMTTPPAERGFSAYVVAAAEASAGVRSIGAARSSRCVAARQRRRFQRLNILN